MARLVAISSSACGLDAPEPVIQPVFFILLRHYFMTRSKTAASSTGQSRPAIIVRHSPVHGNDIFTTSKIPAGEFVIEYTGEHNTQKQTNKQTKTEPNKPNHTKKNNHENGK